VEKKIVAFRIGPEIQLREKQMVSQPPAIIFKPTEAGRLPLGGSLISSSPDERFIRRRRGPTHGPKR